MVGAMGWGLCPVNRPRPTALRGPLQRGGPTFGGTLPGQFLNLPPNKFKPLASGASVHCNSTLNVYRKALELVQVAQMIAHTRPPKRVVRYNFPPPFGGGGGHPFSPMGWAIAGPAGPRHRSK